MAEGGQQQQSDDVDDLDHRVDRRARGVLVGIAQQRPGSAEGRYIDWLTIADNAKSVVEEVTRNHPLVNKSIPIHGYICDVKSGRLTEVPEASQVGGVAAARARKPAAKTRKPARAAKPAKATKTAARMRKPAKVTKTAAAKAQKPAKATKAAPPGRKSGKKKAA